MEQSILINHHNSREYERAELEQELDAVIDRAFILVTAPSGYGKSTLIRGYFSRRKDLRCIWFPMRRDEVDEQWIWRRICEKTKEHNPALYERVSRLSLPQSTQEMAYLIRVLRTYITRPVYLIVDDYQECNSSVMDGLLEEIIAQVEMVHIVLISRIYPDIPCEELFLKGKGALFNQQNLTLQKKEVAQIFREHQICLQSQELDWMYEYTDGWISAVYLALAEYQKNGSFGSFFGVSHLMKTAIFDKLTPQMQEFYMKMSLFDWFTYEEACYVAEMDVLKQTVFASQGKFGFLYYDNKTGLFQMHTLLRTVAETQLQESGMNCGRLYHRAGEWYEKEKRFITAVRYYSKEKNWPKIVALYAGEQGKTMIQQAPEVFEELKEEIWEQIWEQDPMAWMHYLAWYVEDHSRKKAKKLYERTLERIKNSEKWKTDGRILGEMQVFRSLLVFNDLTGMNRSLAEACELLGYQKSVMVGDSMLTYGTTCMTLLYYNHCGELKQVIEQEKEYAGYYMHLTSGMQEDWETFFDAEYAVLTGDMETAYRLCKQVCSQMEHRQQTCILISCYYMMLRCQLYFGERKAFWETMEKLHHMKEQMLHPLLVVDIELAEGYLYACLDKPQKIPDWLKNFRLENCSRAIRSVRSGCMTYGKLLCMQEKWQMLDLVADEMLVPFEETVHIHPLIVGYIYKAIARFHMGQSQRAAEYLREAVAFAQPDGIPGPFWENRKELEPVAKLLDGDTFLQSVIPYAQQYEKGRNEILKQEHKKTSRLTAREQELMGYLEEGLRNAQIAEKMHIAQVTVEKNLTSIYRKLGVSNRTAAITQWKKIGKMS